MSAGGAVDVGDSSVGLGQAASNYCVSFHVDYFDGGSWADGYSDAGYSARQRAYEFKRFSGLYYTPQMIVNGEYQTLGHNRASAYGASNRVLKNRLRSTSPFGRSRTRMASSR